MRRLTALPTVAVYTQRENPLHPNLHVVGRRRRRKEGSIYLSGGKKASNKAVRRRVPFLPSIESLMIIPLCRVGFTHEGERERCSLSLSLSFSPLILFIFSATVRFSLSLLSLSSQYSITFIITRGSARNKTGLRLNSSWERTENLICIFAQCKSCVCSTSDGHIKDANEFGITCSFSIIYFLNYLLI